VWAHLNIFPKDRDTIKLGNQVQVNTIANEYHYSGKITYINQSSESNQAIIARVPLKNPNGKLISGDYVSAAITVKEDNVPLAVKRTALQESNNSSLVYIQVGDQYEARKLQLGRKDNQWVEVLSGITKGTKYVSKNSYIVRADIEKAGVSHDH
jgi:cobalt-zinc-cadmium efflux system membrane fusion protein